MPSPLPVRPVRARAGTCGSLRLTVLAVVASLLAGLAASCTGDDGRPEGSLRWGSCTRFGGPSGDGFECATLRVPLDHDEPGGRKISLAVGRHRATGGRVGSLLINPGGPGGSGLEFLFSSPLGERLTSRFDVVSWDPRGVGKSTAFRCGSGVDEFLRNDPDPDTPAEQTAMDRDAAAVSDECAREDPELVGNVGTDQVARDLDALRAALGERRVNYFGFSYGTLIGLRYLDLFPTKVRTMVLDGVVDPRQEFEGWLEQQARSIEATLGRIFESCDNDPACKVKDMAAVWDRVRARVEDTPLPADRGRELGPAEMETGTVYVTYEPSLWTDLDDALAAADRGDGGPMMDLADGYYDLGGFTAYAAVECLDSERPADAAAYRAFADRLRSIAPRTGGSVANELLPCATWPAAPQPITGEVQGEGAPTVLVLGNRGDAATPYENSVAVADMLRRAQLVSYDGEGHTSYGRTRCVDDVVDAYLIGRVVPRTDPDC